MAGKFEPHKDKSGKFRFRLQASNGQVIATGEAYETKASALNGVEPVKIPLTPVPWVPVLVCYSLGGGAHEGPDR